MSPKETVHIHVPNGKFGLTRYESSIRSYLKEGITRAAQLITVPETDLNVHADSERATYLGIGWRNTQQGEINVLLRPPQKKQGEPDAHFHQVENRFLQVLERNLPAIIARALYVELRREEVGYGSTLSKDIITEGFASNFLREFGETRVFPWDAVFPLVNLDNWIGEVRRASKGESYDAEKWFHGERPKQVPRWTGFTVGYLLVQAYLREHPESLPSTLISQEIVV